MIRNHRTTTGSALLILLAACLPVLSQIKVTYGEIAGSITDPKGQRLSTTTITVTDAARGLRRVTSADASGEYRSSLLPPGRYTVEFQAAGFTAVVVEGVEVRVGESVELSAKMAIRPSVNSITITAQSQAIEPGRVQQANWLESEKIASLPINRRNYLDFALLAPGLVETNSLADGTDYRIPSTPHSGLGVAGSNGAGTSFTIDGFSNTGITGNMRPSVPQAGVQEFQINRNSYSAEYGGGYAGAINIVTRSGSDDVHAEVFGYLRNRAIQARNYFDPGKSAFTRIQSGASAGGPLRKGHTYWFAALEGLDRNESVFVPLLNDPGVLSRLTASQQQLLGFLDRSGVPQLQGLSAAMRGALTPTGNPLVLPLFTSNSGVFPFSASGVQGHVRFDHRPSERNSFFFRANFTSDTAQNTKLGAQNAYNRGSSTEDTDTTQALGFTHIFNPQWIAETRLSFGYFRFAGRPNDSIGPALDISGYGNFGRDPQFPADTRTRYLQMQQYFTYVRSKHALKFGADVNPARNTVAPQVYMGGRFIFSNFIPLGQILNINAGSPDFAAGLAGTLAAFGQPALAQNLNEPITGLQAYALGLPVYYVQAFGDPTFKGWQQHYSSFIEDSWHPRPGLTISTGLRYQSESTVGLPGSNTFSPRFGFAWSPQEKMVVRGGYGLLQAFSDFEVPYAAWSAQGPGLTYAFIPITGISVINPRTRQPLNSADIYQTLFAEGIIGRRPIQAQDMVQFGIPAGFRYPNLGGLASDFVNPYSHQASLEVERSFGGISASVAYNFSRTLHLPRIRDINLYQAGVRPGGWPVFGKIDPKLDFNHRVESAANASYNALVTQLTRRFHDHWTLQAHYTWSKALDEVVDLTPDYKPHNQLDARGDRSLSSFNQSHRFVANAVFQSPSNARSALARDWTVSFITIASSGQPFNVTTGTDNMGDGEVTNHRPLGLGRNMGKGPNLFTADFRVGRMLSFQKDSKLRLELTAEVFNALNRTNFESVNSVVGEISLQALPAQIVGRRGDPTAPFSFISARDPRQFQFGMKLAF